jgi:hydroxyacylglutathione hydrolase
MVFAKKPVRFNPDKLTLPAKKYFKPMKIKVFVFNLFQENTYVLYDETGECVIVDPGCFDPDEEEELSRFLENEKLKPVYCLNTHAHIDHVLGNNYVSGKYKIPVLIHPDAAGFFRNAPAYGNMFGLRVNEIKTPDTYYNSGDEVRFGNSVLKVVATPGHADGSVCLLAEADEFLISGDVLFYESIGRTDLPTGNLDTLLDSIHRKLFTLPDSWLVYPGHGHETTIGHEKMNNPFL